MMIAAEDQDDERGKSWHPNGQKSDWSTFGDPGEDVRQIAFINPAVLFEAQAAQPSPPGARSPDRLINNAKNVQW
jgi:hypothetical protein